MNILSASPNCGPLLLVTQMRVRVGKALGIGKRTVHKINEKYGPSGSEDNEFNFVEVIFKIVSKRDCDPLY